MNIILEAALLYKSMGFSVIPVRSNKRSLYEWEQYQRQIMSDDELLHAFCHSDAEGIAIICGEVSGNLELIDMDSKNDLTGKMFESYYDALQTSGFDVLKMTIAQTKNKGYHFYYRCPEISGNMILARRPTTETEKQVNPDEKARVLIETRGRGGYVIVYPTLGYRFIQNDLTTVPLLTPSERVLLLDLSRSYNLYHQVRPSIPRPSIHYFDMNSPLNEYDARGDIISLLERHGWKVVYHTGVRTYFRRPGVTDHDTSGDYNHELGWFGVFTTSSPDFERGRAYRPSAVYAILECNGDFTLAAKQLLAEGYGIAYKQRG